MQRSTMWLVMATLLAAAPTRAQFQRVADPGQIVRPKTTFKTTDEGKSVAFSPDGKSVATTAAKIMQVWDVASNGDRPKTTMPQNPDGHTQPLTSVAWSPDGKFVASAAKDGKIKLWDPQTGHRVAEADGGAGVTMQGLAFSPDGKTLAASVGGALTIYDAAALRKQAQVVVPNETVVPVRYTSDGKEIVTASASHGWVRFYDATSGRVTHQWRTADGDMHGLAHAAATSDGKLVACASTVGANPKKVEIHDGVSGRVTATIPVDDDAMAVAFSPNGRLLAIAVMDHTIKLFDVAASRVKATFQGHTDGPISVAFSTDSTMLVSGAASTAVLWDVPH